MTCGRGSPRPPGLAGRLLGDPSSCPLRAATGSQLSGPQFHCTSSRGRRHHGLGCTTRFPAWLPLCSVDSLPVGQQLSQPGGCGPPSPWQVPEAASWAPETGVLGGEACRARTGLGLPRAQPPGRQGLPVNPGTRRLLGPLCKRETEAHRGSRSPNTFLSMSSSALF